MTEDHKGVLAELFQNTSKHTRGESDLVGRLTDAFEHSGLSLAQRLHNFPLFLRRQDIARFLAKYELFKQILPVNGSIVECGVFAGSGLMTWAHLSAILEPYNHTRRVIGFDSFSGFPDVHDKDTQQSSSEYLYSGAFRTYGGIVGELRNLAEIHDDNRPLGHIPKVDLAVGDARETIIKYVELHPHLLISMIYLDFDLYEPTRIALQKLYPRVPKGGIVAFDELNCEEFPGETLALLETLDMSQVELRRLPFDPYISYFVK
jgi:hypothetical protein